MKIFRLEILAGVAIGLWLAYAITPLVSQPASPAAIGGCVVVSAPPVLAAGTSTVFTCDTGGRLRVLTTP